ncbi:MAG: single-stranded DNA-binding protein [Arenibacter sp.]|uniref:Single-stranded DNA-binding protein n=1 Tax=Arenibacter aquaticus TaxID=2489054 RepID=A0A430K674_9FLAO|nr:single-stranded DNA-binding protein [Arenibacter aquaticus]NNG11428.1 single-stranded DNA-binding protein [Arenibacter sp.]RTE54535.1 single-stranded DNA-binding protein [Arenibacter aquaticus]
MSGTLNKVMLIGHLGDEVKIHYFDGGNCIGRFPLATNETYTNKQTGERVTNTDWHNVVVRNKAAEICEKYLGKGDKIYVEGRLKNRQWQGEDGNTRYTTEVHVHDFTFLSTKSDSNANAQSANQKPQQSPSPTTNKASEPLGGSEAEQEDDLPF